MLTARDIMTTEVVTIGPEATVREAAALMIERGAGALPVLKDGRLVGILSHTDYTLHEGIRPVSGAYTMMRQLLSAEHMEVTLAELADRPVTEVMESDVSTANEDTPIWRIAQRMARERIHHMPIVNGDRVVGIVAMQDFLKAVLRSSEA